MARSKVAEEWHGQAFKAHSTFQAPPVSDRWVAYCNRVLLALLVAAHGTKDETMRGLLADKNRVAKQLRDAYGDKDAPEDELLPMMTAVMQRWESMVRGS